MAEPIDTRARSADPDLPVHAVRRRSHGRRQSLIPPRSRTSTRPGRFQTVRRHQPGTRSPPDGVRYTAKSRRRMRVRGAASIGLPVLVVLFRPGREQLLQQIVRRRRITPHGSHAYARRDYH